MPQYKSALASAPTNAQLILNLGLAYYKKGDYKSAHDQFETLHKAQPNDLRVAILLGDTSVRTGNPGSAVALLTPFEPANSDNLDLEYALGSALIASGKLHDGVQRIQKVAEAGNSRGCLHDRRINLAPAQRV